MLQKITSIGLDENSTCKKYGIYGHYNLVAFISYICLSKAYPWRVIYDHNNEVKMFCSLGSNQSCYGWDWTCVIERNYQNWSVMYRHKCCVSHGCSVWIRMLKKLFIIKEARSNPLQIWWCSLFSIITIKLECSGPRPLRACPMSFLSGTTSFSVPRESAICLNWFRYS